MTPQESRCTLRCVIPSDAGGASPPSIEHDRQARRAQELTALLDLLPDGVMEFDREGRCILFNAGAGRIVNRRREEWIGKTLPEVAPEAIGTTFDLAFQRCRVDRVPTTLEQAYYPIHDRWYQSTFQPNGEGVLLHFRDVTFAAKRSRAGRVIPLELAPTDLAQLCRRAVAEAEALSTDRTVKLTVEGDLRGLWDAVWIAQVIACLLGHALDESLPGAEVQITARGGVTDVMLEVHRTGSPVPSARMLALFEPTRDDETAPRRPRPRGLGLFLTKQIVEAHGGTIRAESAVERDTTFIVELPRATAPTEEAR